jgi:ribosome biogenesis GTPase
VTTPHDGAGFDLAALGWDAAWRGALRRRRGGAGLLAARVVHADTAGCRLLTASGLLRATYGGGMLAAAAADPAAWPCPGDWTGLRQWPDGHATIETRLPHRTAVVAIEPRRPSRRLAANLDFVIIAAPLSGADLPRRVARLLESVVPLTVPIVVALTGAPAAGRSAQHAARLDTALCEAVSLAAPDAPDTTVVRVGARTAGVAPLAEMLGHARCAALLGVPGAGRSALIDALAGATVLAAPRRARAGARHGAEWCRGLVTLPSGGSIIDTRELRAIGRRDDARDIRALSYLDPAHRMR